MRGPPAFIEHLREEHYHPRSDAHSNAVCRGVMRDLLDTCPSMSEQAREGRIVASLNHTVTRGYQRWNIDLAVGPPPGSPNPPGKGPSIRWQVPTVVQLAVEVKGVMTEHGKARRNRLRDLHAFHSHAHEYDRSVVAGGVVVVNVSPVFWSPLRGEEDITAHESIDRIGRETVEMFRNLPLRDDPTNGSGLEGVAVLVVSHDNLGKHPNLPSSAPEPAETVLVTGPPAPPQGDPLHYATFVHRLCRAFERRWV